MTVGSQLLCHNIPLPAALSTSATLTHSTRSFFISPKFLQYFTKVHPKFFEQKKTYSYPIRCSSHFQSIWLFCFFPSFHRFCSSFMLTSCVLCNTSHFNWHHFRIPISAKFFPFFFLGKILFDVTIKLKITLKWSSTLNWKDFF